MSGTSLRFEIPIRDAISRIRFAPQSNNLLVSSWDYNIRLYDVDASITRFESLGASTYAIFDCCFQNEKIVFSAASDGTITRYDLCSGIYDKIGSHDDSATCVQYSDETGQLISAGWDGKIMSHDTRMIVTPSALSNLDSEVDSMSISRFNLMAAAGESVYMYDLRNLQIPLQSKESCLNSRIKCVCSLPNICEGFAAGTVDGRVALETPNSSGLDDQGYVFRCHPKSGGGKKEYLITVNDIIFNPCMPGIFVTGDNEGYVFVWDSKKKRRRSEFKKCPNSVSSLSYNNGGEFLAIASSHTCQEAKEIEEAPQIFVHRRLAESES